MALAPDESLGWRASGAACSRVCWDRSTDAHGAADHASMTGGLNTEPGASRRSPGGEGRAAPHGSTGTNGMLRSISPHARAAPGRSLHSSAAMALSLELFWKGDAWTRHTRPPAPRGAWYHPHGQRPGALPNCSRQPGFSKHPQSHSPSHSLRPRLDPPARAGLQPGTLHASLPPDCGAEGPLPRCRQVSSQNAGRSPAELPAPQLQLLPAGLRTPQLHGTQGGRNQHASACPGTISSPIHLYPRGTIRSQAFPSPALRGNKRSCYTARRKPNGKRSAGQSYL